VLSHVSPSPGIQISLHRVTVKAS